MKEMGLEVCVMGLRRRTEKGEREGKRVMVLGGKLDKWWMGF